MLVNESREQNPETQALFSRASNPVQEREHLWREIPNKNNKISKGRKGERKGMQKRHEREGKK